MNLINFVPNAGRMPVLHHLPTLIQQSVTKLEKLPCVAGVISGTPQGSFTTLLIDFKDNTNMEANRNAILQCFAAPGISVKGMFSEMALSQLKITLSTPKILLN
ncbi:hypothetical protein [Flavobacterium sp. AG291]|uniref:hypothetical protein n=1 Tax=Flavobacterium sp. AG291 TaxID=2184000 RepID=UPI000E0A2080|nr:hypothetical protein [Flavobacterium sp. AG291]RDI07067.1 hypothetical protein DEU42_113167 [Flavobacterium sp. AG291]